MGPAATAIVDGNDGARYPVLSEQLSTGNVYVAWQDFKDSVHEDISVQDIRPSNSAIFMAYYEDGTPRYTAARTREALITRIRQHEPDATFKANLKKGG